MGDSTAEGSSAIGDGGQTEVSLTPDIDDTGSGLEIKTLHCCTLYQTVRKVHTSTTTCRGCTHMTMYARHVN